MALVLTGDIHWTARPGDNYRWSLVPFIEKLLLKDHISGLIIAGDLTETKDRHSAAFASKVRAAFETWAATGKAIVFVMGNHDCHDPEHPFFEFLGLLPNVIFIKSPQFINIDGDKILCIPHVPSWNANAPWRKMYPLDGDYSMIVAHATFAGSISENGTTRDGVPLSTVSAKRTAGARVFAGDIHTPQEVGNVVCIGAPHAIKFGDHYVPRVIIWNGADRLKYKSIERHGVPGRVLLEIKVEEGKTVVCGGKLPREGDQVKIRAHLTREQMVTWSALREKLKKKFSAQGITVAKIEVVVVGLNDAPTQRKSQAQRDVWQYFDEYCHTNGVDDARFNAGAGAIAELEQ